MMITDGIYDGNDVISHAQCGSVNNRQIKGQNQMTEIVLKMSTFIREFD